ncbi:uncharacterized protein ARMOST_03030 [Armillaria ostoyae]|uniref:Uncharacterized protein n=1 Tax=Armillaria ostoyae TaxID=47428 RepID=A0A284QTF0_ARMOS|nr:uncharacterized protein ARMOST_03030 [Armillaria ostoyae]
MIGLFRFIPQRQSCRVDFLVPAHSAQTCSAVYTQSDGSFLHLAPGGPSLKPPLGKKTKYHRLLSLRFYYGSLPSR